MAVYKPKRKGDDLKFYVCEFVYQGKRVRESTGCTTKTAAKAWEQNRRKELERAHAGLPSDAMPNRIRSVNEVIKPYLGNHALNHRESTTSFARFRLSHVKRLLGNVLLADLSEDRIREYIRQRLSDGVSGRTINMELGELSRGIGHPWSVLWPKVRKLEERKDIGRALSPEEQGRILDAAAAMRSPTIRTIIPVLLLTGMRSGEAMSLQWRQVDLLERLITVGRAKTSSGTGRTIPINAELSDVIASHRQWFTARFGEPQGDEAVFPFGSPQPTNPARSVTDIRPGWVLLLKSAGVKCRPHDLRHTFATGLAEAGTPETTMLALMGHMSRSMLERYSHIRMTAKRAAVEMITLRPKRELSNGVPRLSPVPVPTVKIQ